MRLSNAYSSKLGNYISLTIEDELSLIKFARFEMTYEQLGKLIANTEITIPAEIIGLDNVGKKREIKPLIFEVDSYWDKEEMIEKAKLYVDEGWQPILYFGSQNSRFTEDNKHYARTSQYRFVDPT